MPSDPVNGATAQRIVNQGVGAELEQAYREIERILIETGLNQGAQLEFLCSIVGHFCGHGESYDDCMAATAAATRLIRAKAFKTMTERGIGNDVQDPLRGADHARRD